MITDIALTVFQYSAAVSGTALVVWLGAGRWAHIRKTALRIAVTFGVVLASSGYVWLDLGPEVDAELAVGKRPTLPEPPKELDI